MFVAPGLWGDYCQTVDPARGTYLLGAHDGPLTTELLDHWVKDVHEPFRARGHHGRVSDLVIASSEAFPDDLLKRAGECGVHLHRRLDYERIIDTERWREHQTARLGADREYPQALYIEQRVTLWSPVDDRRESVERAADRVADMLCAPDGCFVMVLGPAGTG